MRRPPGYTLFPYTTLFRSVDGDRRIAEIVGGLPGLAVELKMNKVELIGKTLWKGKRSEEHTSELQSQSNLVCRLLLEKKKNSTSTTVASSAAISAPACG